MTLASGRDSKEAGERSSSRGKPNTGVNGNKPVFQGNKQAHAQGSAAADFCSPCQTTVSVRAQAVSYPSVWGS